MMKVTQLEERIVLDAAAMIDAADQLDQQDQASNNSAEYVELQGADVDDAVADVVGLLETEDSSVNQLILVSSALTDHQQLADDLTASGAEVLVYDAGNDSVADVVQMVTDLADNSGSEFSSLVLLSHGAEGEFNLGNETITAENVSDYADQLNSLNAVLEDGGQFIIYGCNVYGDNAEGQELLDQLSQSLDAQVFASDDITGSDGDWILEGASSGAESATPEVDAASFQVLQAYQGNLLVAAVVDLNPDGSNNPADNAEAPPAGFDYVTTYSEDGADVQLVDTDMTITDVDSVTLEDGNLQITDPGNGDKLLVNGSTALAGTVLGLNYSVVETSNPFTGAVTNIAVYFSGTADFATYIAAFQTITYTNTSDNPTQGDRTINVVVLGTGDADRSVAALTRLHVLGVNDAPVNTLQSTSETVNEDTDLVFNAANGNLISIDDVDATVVGVNDPMLMTLSVTSGTLNLGTTNGLVNLVGNGSDTVTFEGSIAEVNAALDGLTYRGTANFNGNDTLTISTNDQGNTGNGGALSDTDTVAITVNPVNDAPVAGVPAAQTVDEDVALVFNAASGNAITVTDVDAHENGAADPMSVTISVTNGTLTLNAAATAALGSVNGDGTNSVTFTGTVAEVNAALEGLTYLGSSNYNGPDTFNMLVNDQANSGAVIGVDLTDTASFGITVNAVNDGPVNTVPATNIDPLAGAIVTEQVREDSPLTFSAAGGNGLSIADVDANESGATDPMLVTLTVTNGTLTVANSAGLATFNGDGTNTVTLEGSIAEINAALEGLVYQGTLNYNGPETLTIVTSDQGNTGSGGALTDTDVVNIEVLAVDDAPINTVPAAQTVDEDADLVFNAATGNAISIADIDAAESGNADPMLITLSVANGTLTLGSTAGLTSVNNNGTATVSFQGTVLEVNTALEGLTYRGDLDFNGNDTLTIVTNDQGNTGLDGPLSDTDTVAITVNPVNDAPVNTVPATNIDPLAGAIVTEDVLEDNPLTFSAATGNQVSVSDVDAADGGATDPLLVTLTVTQGTITLAQTTGLTNVTGDGSASISIEGTENEINDAINGLVYNPTANYNGPDTLTIVTNDQGNTGSGGAQTDTDVVNINVIPVNDPPINVVPGAQFANEGTNIVFNAANGNALSISDIDAAESGVADPMQVTVSVLNGSLALGSTTGLTNLVGNNSASITMEGTAAEINNALEGLTYSLVGAGTDTLTLNTNDQGNTGQGGVLSDLDTVAITINDVPDINLDPPNNSGGADDGNFDATFREDGLPVSVVDPAATLIDTDDTTLPTFTITAGNIQDGNNEIIAINGTQFPLATDQTTNVTVGGTTFTVVYDSATGQFDFSNSAGGEMPVADIQTLIRSITYENTSQTPTTGAGTDRTLTFNVNDGNAPSNSAVATITVDAVPDPSPDTESTFLGGTFTATTVYANDTDPGDAPSSFHSFDVTGTNGTVVFNADGTYTYTSDGAFVGVDTFTYTIQDVDGDTGTATVSITITPVVTGAAATPVVTATTPDDEGATVSGAPPTGGDVAPADVLADTEVVPEASAMGGALGFGGAETGT